MLLFRTLFLFFQRTNLVCEEYSQTAVGFPKKRKSAHFLEQNCIRLVVFKNTSVAVSVQNIFVFLLPVAVGCFLVCEIQLCHFC